jgi:hypothetical protein
MSQRAVRVRLTTITEQERRDLRAQEAYLALRPALDQDSDVFLGRLMVAFSALRQALARGGSEQATVPSSAPRVTPRTSTGRPMTCSKMP